jgi:hypothetical protein
MHIFIIKKQGQIRDEIKHEAGAAKNSIHNPVLKRSVGSPVW